MLGTLIIVIDRATKHKLEPDASRPHASLEFCLAMYRGVTLVPAVDHD